MSESVEQPNPCPVDNSDAPTIEALSLGQPQWIGRYRVATLLGEGGFGRVYLAHDERLHRDVAIKVPHRRLLTRPEDVDACLTEARTVALLDHPNIVPVYDVGSSADYPCFIVSKFIEGSTLSRKLRERRLSLLEAAQLVATVAEALHHAHHKGLVHRDVKPGNILLDADGIPFVVDFGLALREENVGQGPRYAGTPAYMSPEQARGEGHRVDGRSDIFSLGVVFYELLVGRHPFRGDPPDEVLEQVTRYEPRPLRQCDDRIPKELERICHKALAKRPSERYTTAKDLAEDLRHFLAEQTVQHPSGSDRVNGSYSNAPSSSSTPSASAVTATPTSASQPLRIVPKGLRSFDAQDADFYLELLPGPHDRDNLPNSVRFWKRRIEERDPDNTFSVGVIYGPSGCGKSSLVKAGVLPRLTSDIIPVYLEASADKTEARLLTGLRKRCPDLSPNLSLKEALAALRRGQGLPAGKKVAIVLDQFEQWLHARQAVENTELVQALRQCDGGRVQCIVMVRDDFWLAISRFMRELEIRLVEGENSALVDLFDVDHARKVLAAFGRAFGKLPEDPRATSKDQHDFVNEAVADLALEGKLICVRLALFAEMMKGKTWSPASLRQVGGTAGVGVTFLEETFSAAAAPPQHRLHQKAARAVLNALLPESGTEIKGQMRSRAALLEASGYRGRAGDFEELLSLLDSEIRLITPTDPEGKEANDERASGTARGQQYYELTHDFLVPSLRVWLTGKLKETRRGRAELRLAERALLWHGKPEKRYLPSWWEWLNIRLFTRPKTWTDLQKRMMRQADRHHAARGVVLALFLLLAGIGGWEGYGRLRANTLRDRLLESNTSDVPAIVKDMKRYRRWADPLLHEAAAEAQEHGDARKRLHASLALLPVDHGQIEYLHSRLLRADPQEFLVIREALAAHRHDLISPLWALLEDQTRDQDERFRAACALASYDPDSARWEKVSGDVAAKLVTQNAFVLAAWTSILRPVGKALLPSLATFLEDEKRRGPERGLIATVYGNYAAEVPDAFDRLEQRLAERPDADASAEAVVALKRKQANCGVALLIMGHEQKVWPLLRHRSDPTLRNLLVERLAPAGVDPKILTTRLEKESHLSTQRAILLALGEYGLDRLPRAERQNLLPRILRLYHDHPDPGIHGAAAWLIRQWEAEDALRETNQTLATGKVEGSRHWYINRQGQTLTIVNKPSDFWVGEKDERHLRRVERRFAIAATEVTVEQFLRFRADHSFNDKIAPTQDCPVNKVSWYEAAEYCNWLSEREGLPQEQWCYLPNADGKYAIGMKLAPNYLQRMGYRLPTEAEWICTCQARAETDYFFGASPELIHKHTWNAGNSSGRSHAVATLKPNDFGVFDMPGNAWEWTQSVYKKYAKGDGDFVTLDREEPTDVSNTVERVLCGGSWGNQPADVRAGYRLWNPPWHRHIAVGFRPARTMPAE